MTTTVKPRGSFGSRRRLTIAAVVIVAAMVFLVFQGLGNATVYFKTADEAVRDRAKLGTHRFRIEGTVVSGSERTTIGNGLEFSIAANGVTVPVVHHGDEPPLFKDQLTPPPVVLEGRFEGDTFTSDRIIVKHSESYTEQHPERLSTSSTIPAR
jgi:cytochrome c-type biogenesis protein CcmE